MTLAIFSPINIDSENRSLQVKTSDSLIWLDVSLNTGSYPTLQELLANLSEKLFDFGMQVRLQQRTDHCGAQVLLWHTQPVQLNFPATGCHEVLGFSQGLHSPAQPLWSSPNNPANTMLCDDPSQDDSPFTTSRSSMAMSLTGVSNSQRISAGQTRNLQLSALSPDQLARLQSLWLGNVMDRQPLYLKTDWGAELSSDAYLFLDRVHVNVQSGTEFRPRRCWSLPNPAFYNVSLPLEYCQ